MLIAAASIAMFFFHFVPYTTAILVTLTLIVVESRPELLSPFAISFAPSIGLSLWYALDALCSSRCPYIGRSGRRINLPAAGSRRSRCFRNFCRGLESRHLG